MCLHFNTFLSSVFAYFVPGASEDFPRDPMAALHLPRNIAYFQDHVTLADTASISYVDGELVWAGSESENGSSAEGLPPAKIKDEEIVFVVDQQRHSSAAARYVVFRLKDNREDTAAPFRLSALVAPELPQEVLDRHLLKSVPESLQGLAEHKLHVIVSTKSGTGLAQRFHDDVLRPLLAVFRLYAQPADSSKTPGDDVPPQEELRPYDLIVTKSSQSIKEFSQQLASQSSKVTGRTVVLLSGDGGVVDLLNGVGESNGAKLQPAIALFPLGTGNALFSSLHRPYYTATDGPIPSPFVLGLRTLFRGSPAPLPVFRASFSPGSKLITYSPAVPETAAQSDGSSASGELEEHAEGVDHLLGAIVASYGFHAQLVWESDTPEYRKHGDKRFGMIATELLKTSHAYKATVDIQKTGAAPGGTAPLTRLDCGEYNYILATLVSNLERTFTISPASRPLDGQLRLVHFGDVGGGRTMDIMMQAYNNGAHVGMSWTDEEGKPGGVGYDEVDEVKVTILEADARWRKVCIDGVIVEIPEGGWMSVRKVPDTPCQILYRPRP